MAVVAQLRVAMRRYDKNYRMHASGISMRAPAFFRQASCAIKRIFLIARRGEALFTRGGAKTSYKNNGISRHHLRAT